MTGTDVVVELGIGVEVASGRDVGSTVAVPVAVGIVEGGGEAAFSTVGAVGVQAARVTISSAGQQNAQKAFRFDIIDVSTSRPRVTIFQDQVSYGHSVLCPPVDRRSTYRF